MNSRPKTLEQLLTEERLEKVARHVAAAPAKRVVPERRAEQRWRYRRYDVGLEVQQAGGTFARFTVIARDLSSRGLGFFHTELLFPKAFCTLTLPRENNDPYIVEGRIAYCRAVPGAAYEVGVLFNNRVDEEILKLLLPEPEPTAWLNL
jgi:hypothetical protein